MDLPPRLVAAPGVGCVVSFRRRSRSSVLYESELQFYAPILPLRMTHRGFDKLVIFFSARVETLSSLKNRPLTKALKACARPRKAAIFSNELNPPSPVWQV